MTRPPRQIAKAVLERIPVTSEVVRKAKNAVEFREQLILCSHRRASKRSPSTPRESKLVCQCVRSLADVPQQPWRTRAHEWRDIEIDHHYRVLTKFFNGHPLSAP